MKAKKVLMKPLVALITCLIASVSFGQIITSVSPSSGEQGTVTLPITISGSGTSFSNATSTVVEISQGTNTLQVLSVGAVAPESVDLNIRVSNQAPIGNYTVRVFDQNVGMVDMPNGFTVLPNSNPATLLNTSPELTSGTQQSLPVTITTDNTNFSQATDNTIYLSQGTSTILQPIPGSVTVLNDNAIRASFDISQSGATVGSYFNAHCGNSFDGYFDDMNAIAVTDATEVSGMINYSGTYNGVVELYQENTGINPSTYSLVASTPVVGNSYVVTDLAEATYLIRSVPLGMSDVVATYYPNNILWQNATSVTPVPGVPGQYDITPFPSLIANLLGITVNGTLGYGPNGFNKANIVFAEGVEVFLRDTDNNAYLQTVTDANGAYSFANIPDGNYEIMIDIPGYEQVSTYTFTVSGSSVDMNDLDFLIDNNEIFTSGFMGLPKLDKVNLKVYPNPSEGTFNILLPTNLSSFEISVYNCVGTKVFEESVEHNTSNTFKGDLSGVAEGVYIVRLIGEGLTAETRIVKR